MTASEHPNSDSNCFATPLSGVRVLDLSAVIMGPVCTQVLGEYGADVVKVEPLEGDIMRHAGAARVPGMGAMFLHANRHKRSLAIDLKTAPGGALLRRLLPGFDILVHNMRSEAAARLGLTYEALKLLRRDLIYAQLVGYGPDGPYAGRPAYDDVIQAQSGLASLFACQDGGEPRYLPALIADRMTGMVAAHHILAALYRRQVTGLGAEIIVPMFETMATFVLSDHLGGHSFEPANGPSGYSRLLTQHRRPYRTQDGHIAALVYTDKHWRAFLDLIGEPERFADERFSDAAVRARSYDHVYAVLAEALLKDSTAAWLRRLSAADIPCAPVNAVEDLIRDQHLERSGFFSSDGRSAGSDRAMGRSPADGGRPSPMKGEHSREILAEAGVPGPEIERLIGDGIVADAQ